MAPHCLHDRVTEAFLDMPFPCLPSACFSFCWAPAPAGLARTPHELVHSDLLTHREPGHCLMLAGFYYLLSMSSQVSSHQPGLVHTSRVSSSPKRVA